MRSKHTVDATFLDSMLSYMMLNGKELLIGAVLLLY
jgi:hypothetical protein